MELLSEMIFIQLPPALYFKFIPTFTYCKCLKMQVQGVTHLHNDIRKLISSFVLQGFKPKHIQSDIASQRKWHLHVVLIMMIIRQYIWMNALQASAQRGWAYVCPLTVNVNEWISQRCVQVTFYPKSKEKNCLYIYIYIYILKKKYIYIYTRVHLNKLECRGKVHFFQ